MREEKKLRKRQMHISYFIISFSNNNNTLLNLVADQFPRLESKEIGPDIQK